LKEIKLEYDKNTIDPKERISAVVKELNDERIVEYNRLKEQADNQTFELNRRKRLSSVIQNEMLFGKNADELQNEQSTFGAIASVIGDGARWLADEINPMNIARDAILQPEYSTKKIGAVSRFGANTAINSLEDALKFTADIEDSLRQMGINIPAFSLEEMRFKSSDEMLTERQENAYATGDATSDMNMGRIGNPTEIETMLEPIASYFLTSLFGGGPTKLGGTVLAAGTIDLQEGNLSNVLADFGILPELAEYLGSRPENAEVGYERLNLRVRNLVEEGLLTAAFLALPMTFKMLKNSGVQFTLGTTALTAIPQEAEAKGGVGKLVNRVLDELGFFSEAVEQTKRLDIEKGSGTQFLSLLKKAGVKDEELKWTGLDELLKNKKVTKQEILDQLENNAVEIEEIPKTVRQEDSEMNFSASEENVRLDDAYIAEASNKNFIPKAEKLNSTVTAEEAYGPEYLNNRADEIFEDYGEGTNLTIDDAYNQAVDEYYDSPIRIFEDENTGMVITGNDELGWSIFNNRAESSFWKNRRKTLNNDEVVYDLDEAKIQAQQLAEDDGRLAFADDAVQYEDYTVSGGDNYREFLLTLPNQKGTDFTASHFNEENIVAHFRTTDIKGPNGEKALFIEEIQSDWAQKGRRRGFQLSEEEFKVAKENAEKLAEDFRKILNTYTILHDGKQVPFVDFYDQKLGDEMLGIKPTQMVEGSPLTLDPSTLNNRFINQMNKGVVYKDGKLFDGKTQHPRQFATDVFEAGDRYNAEWRKLGATTPNAPFVSDPKYQRNWTALSIKRILAKAVEEGYEYVSFATGESGAAQNYFARSNDGLQKYYGETVPSVLNKLIKKYDSEALVSKGKAQGVDLDGGLVTDEQFATIHTDVFTDSLKVKLTDKLKNAIKEGQALFAIPTAVTGAGVAMNNTSEMRI
jgi:hypothetical protein